MVKCARCGEVIRVAPPEHFSRSNDSSSVPIQISTSTSPPPRRKDFGLRVAIRLLGHLLITTVSIAAGYYLVWKKVDNHPNVDARSHTRQIPQQPIVREQHAPNDQIAPRRKDNRDFELERQREEQPKELPLEPDPFLSVPTTCDLPLLEQKEFSTLVKLPVECELRILNADGKVTLKGGEILWQDDSGKHVSIGSLLQDAIFLKFRWSDDLPADAECELRNSLIRAMSAGKEHVVALRTPRLAKPLQFDLTKSVKRVTGRCECSPDAEQVFFELRNQDRLPSHSLEGADPSKLQVGEVVTLWYSDAERTATRISMEKVGRTPRVEFLSRYRLPSGNEGPMSIGHMRSLHRELVEQSNLAADAKANLDVLKQKLQLLIAQRKHLPTLRDDLAIEIAKQRESIQFAVDLIADGPRINAELLELEKVEKIAEQLHQLEGLSYRFYMIIEGHEVDLILGQTVE